MFLISFMSVQLEDLWPATDGCSWNWEGFQARQVLSVITKRVPGPATNVLQIRFRLSCTRVNFVVVPMPEFCE